MTQHHRIYTFDLLRGLAVLTMMLAHSVYFFHNRGSNFLVGVESFGNVVSFTTFLLVSGAVAAVAYVSGSQTDGRAKRKRVLNRVLLLLLAYYALALIQTRANLLQAEGFARIRLIFDILSFRQLPGFTEYFPPFIFYSALLALIPRFWLMASRTIKRVIFFSIISWLAGAALYRWAGSGVAQPWVALLAGGPGLFRFPILQYMPVFLVGLYWGHQTLSREGLRAKALLCLRFLLSFVIIVGATIVTARLLGRPLDVWFYRWPPSAPYLALGLGFAFLAAAIFYAFHQLRRVRFIRDLLLLLGQNALGLFWSHVFLLGLYASAGGPHVSSVALFLLFFLLLTLVSLALTTFIPFNFRLALTSARGSHEEYEEQLSEEAVFRLSKDMAAEATLTRQGLRNFFFPHPRTTSRRTLKRRHKLGISLVAMATAALLFPATTEELANLRQQQGANLWWSDSYSYRQQLTLKNTESFVTLKTGTPAALRFDHKKLVAEQKSRADGLDVQLIYWTGDTHLVAQSTMSNPNSDQAVLQFKAPVDIPAGKEEQFYTLYYGGFVPDKPSPVTFNSTATVLASFDSEQAYPLLASVSKSWNIIGTEDGDTVALHLTIPTSNADQTVTYQVLDTELTGNMTRSVDNSWETAIPVSTLKPGAYRIQATLHDGDRQQTSQQTGFYRSYPLYVAWTIDWEGYDVSQAYLDAMDDIATQYQLPMTHFFNPRIYITKTISPARAQTLTAWVQQRIDEGDGYGLHLHMFTDFIEHVGIPVRTEPNWGDSGTGYGVPLSAYTRDEQERLIATAKELLVAHGFKNTDVFRAGGWYANLDTLAALEALGFTVDSSARTAYKFGRNQLPGYWSTSLTMRPYRPSRTNQNVASSTNAFPILEIPDNGADSYAFSAADMISRFNTNIGNGIVSDRQQVTFLSHPHWFDEKEQARVRELFAYVSQYTLFNDRGPVIFTTTKDIATIWNQ